jgi:phosphohistidine phosphatase
MDIYLVQHGQALPKEQDPQRPLSDEGRAATAGVAEHLAARAAQPIDPPISEVRHSGKLRARQTAEILAGVLCPEATLTVVEGMNPEDDPRTIYDELSSGRDRPGAVMLVGHLPHLGRLAGLLLAGDAHKTPIGFANAGVLKICPAPTGWAVKWYLTPACVG